MIVSPIRRFVPKVCVNPDTGCWEWTGAKRDGYGLFKVKGKNVSAHRWSWEFFRGPIPQGLEIDHLCRNRACVNPNHLEPVTKTENMGRIPWTDAARAAHKAGRDKSATMRRTATHCRRGHERTPENIYVTPTGGWSCRKCRALAQRRYSERKKEV